MTNPIANVLDVFSSPAMDSVPLVHAPLLPAVVSVPRDVLLLLGLWALLGLVAAAWTAIDWVRDCRARDARPRITPPPIPRGRRFWS